MGKYLPMHRLPNMSPEEQRRYLRSCGQAIEFQGWCLLIGYVAAAVLFILYCLAAKHA